MLLQMFPIKMNNLITLPSASALTVHLVGQRTLIPLFLDGKSMHSDSLAFLISLNIASRFGEDLLAEKILRHTDNLSKTLQTPSCSAATGQDVAKMTLTMHTDVNEK